MTNIVRYTGEMSLTETMTLSQTLCDSGLFQDTRGQAQAVAKILAGRELGLPPIASMTGINIIQGRISLSANLIAASIKRSGRYDYRVKEMSATRCVVEFFERENGVREQIGVSEFTIDDAKKAGTKNLDKFPRNMLFARAMSNGARWFTPDIFNGPVYTPEELGADVNEEGNVINDASYDTLKPQRDVTLSEIAKANLPKNEHLEYAKAVADATNADELRAIVKTVRAWAKAQKDADVIEGQAVVESAA